MVHPTTNDSIPCVKNIGKLIQRVAKIGIIPIDFPKPFIKKY